MAARVGVAAVVAAAAYLASPDAFALVFTSLYGALGWYLVYRRPRNPVGWLLVAIAVGFVGIASHPAGTIDVASLRAGTAPWPVFLTVWFSANTAGATFIGIFALTVVFPDGHLPVGRMGRVAKGLIAIGLALTVLVALGPVVTFAPDGVNDVDIPNRFGVLSFLPIWQVVNGATAVIPILVILGIGVVWMLVRYRRSGGVLRVQLRWLLAATTAVVIGVAVGVVLLGVFGDRIGGAAWLGAAFAFPTIPLAIVIAVLRYRLWNIDTIINRAIVYALLTAVLAGFTATIVGVAERAFQFAIGPGSDASVLLSTLVIVSVFDPIKRTISGIVDRRFQETEDPAIRLTGFVGEIRAFPGPLDPRRTLQRLAEIARLACHGSSAEIRWTLDGVTRDPLRADAPTSGPTPHPRWQFWRRGAPTDRRPDHEDHGVSATAAAGGIGATLTVAGVVEGGDRGALGPALAATLAELASARAVPTA